MNVNTAAASRLSEIEVVTALARRWREGLLDRARCNELLQLLRSHFPQLVCVEVTSGITKKAQELALRHPLRAGDAIQLASCIHLHERLRGGVRFLAFDRRLRDAAVAEGVPLVALS